MAIGRPCLAHFVMAALPGTAVELERKSGVSKAAVFRAIKQAHANGEVHISKWEYPVKGGRPMPTWVAGAGKDAPMKLKPQTPAESSRRHRTRARRDGRWDLRNATIRARYWEKRAKITGDPLINALFGKLS